MKVNMLLNVGGNIAGNARKDLESQLGKKVISKHNSNNPDLLDD